MGNLDTNIMSYERTNLICENTHSDSTKTFSETDIIKMVECLIENIFVIFGGRGFSTDSGHTYWYKLCSFSRLLVPFLYETDFMHGLHVPLYI